ncbi:uncharacterized protein LOC131939100 [Physella acuta]|uniref:uncharacterized protein LOC131939100 n=1 Tax=Physella acuta TaxID=109671 RepID=UPI0027DE162C|nr:uncharacterized protein LOC131939100 [Physella acuta]
MREKNPSLVSAVNIQTLSDDVKTDAEKVKLLLQSVTRQHDLLQDRLGRIENNLQRQRREIIETKKEEATWNSCLTKIQARLEDVVNLSGIRCQVKDEKNVQVEFLSPLEKIEEESSSDKSRLIVLLEVCEDHLGFLQLTNAKTNQVICGSESIIEAALADKDVHKLILELKTLWSSQVPLITEIQQLRKKHAIDWIPEKNLLYLMVKNSCSVVCTLTVPPQYPAEGDITLESIMGPSNEITVKDVKPPTQTTLTAWISHLENLPWKIS